jgi:hypothetical protein
VNSNCTGNITVDAAVNGIVHRDLVLVDGGKEVDFVDPDPGFLIAGSMKNNNQKSSRHARLCAALILSLSRMPVSLANFSVTLYDGSAVEFDMKNRGSGTSQTTEEEI